MSSLVIFLLLATWSRADISAVTPNLALSPGAADPAVTQENIGETICKSGYTATVRHVSGKVKHQVYEEYGIKSHKSGEYEIDHLISLELGGANDIKNLWPQSYEKNPGAHEKDVVENAFHRAVCCGTMTLKEAQKAIILEWLAYYTKIKDGSWAPCPEKTSKKKKPAYDWDREPRVLEERERKKVEPKTQDGGTTGSETGKPRL